MLWVDFLNCISLCLYTWNKGKFLELMLISGFESGDRLQVVSNMQESTTVGMWSLYQIKIYHISWSDLYT